MPTSPGRPNRAPHDPGSIIVMPAALAADYDLHRTCRQADRLWATLVRVARQDATVTLPPTTLATVMGCSVASVRRYRDALVARGWLEVTPGGGRGHVATWTPLGRATLADVKGYAAEDGRDVTEYVW